MSRVRHAAVFVVVIAAALATSGCEIYDSNGNGVYDSAEISSALWRWWNCDVLGGLGGLTWSCNPHL